MIESNERTDVSAPNDNRQRPRIRPARPHARAGDKERDAVSEILRQRHVEGRLDADEFHAGSTAAWQRRPTPSSTN